MMTPRKSRVGGHMRRGRLGSCSRSEKNITRGAQKIESTESTVSTFVPGEFSDLANPVSGFALRRGQKYAPRSDIAHIGAAKLWSAAPGRSGEGFDCQRPGAHHAAGLSSGGQKAPRNSHVAEKAEKVFRYRTIISRIASKWPRRGKWCVSPVSSLPDYCSLPERQRLLVRGSSR